MDTKEVIDNINYLIDLIPEIKNRTISEENRKSVIVIIEKINNAFWGVREIKIQKKSSLEDYIEQILSIWIEYLNCTNMNEIDGLFHEIYMRYKYVDSEILVENAIKKFKAMPIELQEKYDQLESKYIFLNKGINLKTDNFDIIEHNIKMMADRIEDFKWFYNKLEDYRSKSILLQVVEYWSSFSLESLHSLPETIFCDYFDLDILHVSEEDVLVDAGAFIGDSIIDFVKTYRLYKRIYAYELTPSTFENLKKNTQMIDNIEYRQMGVADTESVIKISDMENCAGNSINKAGDVEVMLTSLDNDINEPIGIIKMDIEGAEKAAIIGAANHIKNDRPRLLISAYHIPEDIFDIPLLINDMRDDYKFYLRYNGKNGVWPCDYVVFAV